MPPSPVSDFPSPPTIHYQDEGSNDIQPFFVMHKASPTMPEKKIPGSSRAKRKIDLPPSPVSSKPAEKCPLSNERREGTDELASLEAFHQSWSKIEGTIKEILRQINLRLFEEVHQWALESFSESRPSKPISLSEIQKPYPLLTDQICKQIPAALIFTKNAEFVDDLLTFQELGGHLRSQGCHVANLSHLDFSIKHGIGNCLRNMSRQLVKDGADMADIAVLSSWYSEMENYDRPIILIIDDIERCNGLILGQLIRMLSEWVIKLPINLVMGIATSIEAASKVLLSDALQYIHPRKFTLGSPSERMDALVEAVLVKLHSGIKIGHGVAAFLRDYFLKYDGTISSFLKALKLACFKHFSSEPLSYLSLGMLDEDFEILCNSQCDALCDTMRRYAFDLPSCKGKNYLKSSADELAQGICELRRLLKAWSSVVLCLCEVGKHHQIQLLDIFCEASDPALSCLRTSVDIPQTSTLNGQNLIDGNFHSSKGGYIAHAIQKVRDMSMPSLSHLLNIWSIHTEEINEIHSKVKELQTAIQCVDSTKTFREQQINGRRITSINMGKGTPSLNDKAALLLDGMVRKYLMPIECMPFHEIVCFRDAKVLHAALIGNPRRTIQVDLLDSQDHIQCSCCSSKANAILPSMHDTSVMYRLAQEYGDLINLHDLYQSFKSTICTFSHKQKNKIQHSPASKKRKMKDRETEASLQARFCRAATELHITGLFRMPSKRRPDFLQRIAFGL